MAGKRQDAGGERRQVTGEAQAQRVQADEENILPGETAFLQRGDEGAHQPERRGQARAGVGVDLESDFLFGARDEVAAGGFLVVLQHLLDGVAVIGVGEVTELVLPDRRLRRCGLPFRQAQGPELVEGLPGRCWSGGFPLLAATSPGFVLTVVRQMLRIRRQRRRRGGPGRGNGSKQGKNKGGFRQEETHGMGRAAVRRDGRAT